MMWNLKTKMLGLAVSCLASFAAHAVPVTLDQLNLSEDQKVALLQQLSANGAAPAPLLLAAPGIVFGSPVGFGQFFGEAALGVGVGSLPPVSSSNGGKQTDGSLAISMGFGKQETVGLEIGLNVISLTGGFGDSGSFSAKLHKMLNGSTAVAVGVESFGPWGLAKQIDPSVFGVVSNVQLLPNGMPLALNMGLGNGRFRDTRQTVDSSKVGVFGGGALLLSQRVSVIVDYSGVGWNAGLSFVPVYAIPLTAALGWTNIAEQDDSTREFAAALGYRVTF